MNALEQDHPRALRSSDVAARYQISERLAADWLRAMVAANVATKIGRTIVGRLSACDEWVSSGGTSKRRGRPLQIVPKTGGAA